MSDLTKERLFFACPECSEVVDGLRALKEAVNGRDHCFLTVEGSNDPATVELRCPICGDRRFILSTAGRLLVNLITDVQPAEGAKKDDEIPF